MDDQIFLSQVRGGISRYFVELMRAYQADPSLDIEVVSRPRWTQNEHLLDSGLGRTPPLKAARRRGVIMRANRLGRGPGSADVMHHTQYDRRYLRHPARVGLRVVTVFDMIPELFPEMFPGGSPHRDKRQFVEAADLILCISEATRADLVRVYGDPTATVRVTPLGVDARFHPNATRHPALPERYVLFVGERGGYKDFDVLLKAFALAELPQDVMLAVVGGGAADPAERANLRSLGLVDRVVRIAPIDSDLPGAYAHAQCFVFPSRYEGFGLPTLEAMACGCPAILAASAAHPEVGGDAALYFPPGDHSELARVLSRLIGRPDLRTQQRAAGLARAQRFTWTETARRTVRAYREGLANQ